MTNDNSLAEVSRIIESPADLIFAILATPQRHGEFDGSGMLRGSDTNQIISNVGDIFTMKMHRLGRDYIMINYVVEFELDRLLVWEPAPGDIDTAGGDPNHIGVPAGYRWGFRLSPNGDNSTVVTEFFDCGSDENQWILQREGGEWINGSNSVVDSMTASLERLARISAR